MPEGEDEGDAAETSSRPGSGRTKRSSWTCRQGAGTAMAAANTATRLGIWRRRRAGRGREGEHGGAAMASAGRRKEGARVRVWRGGIEVDLAREGRRDRAN